MKTNEDNQNKAELPQFEKEYVEKGFKPTNKLKFFLKDRSPFFIFLLPFKLLFGAIFGSIISPKLGWENKNDKIYNTIKTKNGFKTRYLVELNKNDKSKPQDRKIVVCFNGNAVNLDNAKYLFGPNYDFSNKDYLFVGHPKGAVSKDASIQTGEAVIKMLIDKGYKPKNISVFGHSLGGAIATEVLNKFKTNSYLKPGQNFDNFINHKSFSDMGAEVHSLTNMDKGFSKALVNGTSWNFKPGKLVEEGLPVDNLYVVRATQDQVIKEPASLLTHIENYQKSGKSMPYKNFGKLEVDETHNDSMGSNVIKAFQDIEESKKGKISLNHVTKQETPKVNISRHRESSSELKR